MTNLQFLKRQILKFERELIETERTLEELNDDLGYYSHLKHNLEFDLKESMAEFRLEELIYYCHNGHYPD